MATAEEAFARIGVSVTDADGNLKDLDTLLAEVADGLAETLRSDTLRVCRTLSMQRRRREGLSSFPWQPR